MHRPITDIWPDLIVSGEYIQEAVAGIDEQVPAVEVASDAASQESNLLPDGLSDE